jgi:hypothetical protein
MKKLKIAEFPVEVKEGAVRVGCKSIRLLEAARLLSWFEDGDPDDYRHMIKMNDGVGCYYYAFAYRNDVGLKIYFDSIVNGAMSKSELKLLKKMIGVKPKKRKRKPYERKV